MAFGVGVECVGHKGDELEWVRRLPSKSVIDEGKIVFGSNFTNNSHVIVEVLFTLRSVAAWENRGRCLDDEITIECGDHLNKLVKIGTIFIDWNEEFVVCTIVHANHEEDDVGVAFGDAVIEFCDEIACGLA